MFATHQTNIDANLLDKGAWIMQQNQLTSPKCALTLSKDMDSDKMHYGRNNPLLIRPPKPLVPA